MRRKIAVLGGVAVIGTATLLFSACFPINLLDDCERNPNLQCFWADLSSGTSGGGGDGGAPACIPSENGAPVSDDCGLFVSSSAGDDGWEGSKAKPLKTIAAGVKKMAAAKGGNVYACAEEHAGSVTLASGVTLYGGLDCANGWAYVGETKRSELAGSADTVALTITKSEGWAEVVDFTIRAPDAKTAGSSSIAVLAEGVTAALVRCELVAGNGAAGAMGAPGDPSGMPAAGGAKGNNGQDACSNQDLTATVPGGAEALSSCGSDDSIGGSGGDGKVGFGTVGKNGETGSAGLGGLGEAASGCANGGTGSDGMAGPAGAGATGLGSILASGYTGTSGGAGTSGNAGQGGGGGGGAKGGLICPSDHPPETTNGSGASGGSGGGGGCGGLPGQGGGPGGASIALVSLNAELTLTDTTLTAAKGGDGGAGGDAQNGGPGGPPGKGGKGVGDSKSGCSGGNGGKGGDGGPGGGGLGGPSLGIAFQGAPPQTHGKTIVMPGTPGAGGPGGSKNVANNPGDTGIASEQQELP